MQFTARALTLSLLVALGAARDVPANVKALHDSIVKQGRCNNPLATGFYSQDNGKPVYSYCGDHLQDKKIIYLQGPAGNLADMDVDCDGVQHGAGDDGRCGSSSDTQSQTSFQDTVRSYGKGIKDLNAFVHPYVVFGNEGQLSGYKNFHPQEHGIEPLSLMAVVCGDKLIYGIWGDTNGDDYPKALVGEASISVATACFGKGINGDAGHDKNDVLYIAFTGKDAVPGANGAHWGAQTYNDFAQSIRGLGDKLIQRIK
ncbi:glycoside hydrolase family 75 protein [Fusarium sporotrichioides]|uniref:Endo-chitosanase n=1 Tax=Fusarium sporotrichioides TaxID=5514 RepID=A0A395RFI1_FUSSP|nr:glycoside hydrolase family 75 protein [Fusarium sporotrichioides]